MSFFITCVIILICLAWLTSTIVITQQKTIKILETFGKYSGLREPGLSFKLPAPFQTVREVVEMNVMELKTELELKTKDNLFIKYPIIVQYKVSDPVAATYELEEPQQQLLSYISNLVRSEVGQRSFLELYAVRSEIQNAVEETLSEQMHAYGFKIVAVLVNEPIPTDEVQASFNSVTASLRQLESAKNTAEATRITLVATAEAEKESKKLQGEGIADQRTAIAKGFKEATESISDALGISNELATVMILQLNKFDTIRDAANGKGTLIITDGGSGSQLDEIAHMLGTIKSSAGFLKPNVEAKTNEVA